MDGSPSGVSTAQARFCFVRIYQALCSLWVWSKMFVTAGLFSPEVDRRRTVSAYLAGALVCNGF